MQLLAIIHIQLTELATTMFASGIVIDDQSMYKGEDFVTQYNAYSSSIVVTQDREPK